MMMTYDPREDPRYLDPDAFEDDPLAYVPDDLLAQAYNDLRTIAAIRDLADMEGWSLLMSEFQKKWNEAQAKVLRAEDLTTLHRQQGVIATLNWLLRLQEEYAREEARLSDLTVKAEKVRNLEE